MDVHVPGLHKQHARNSASLGTAHELPPYKLPQLLQPGCAHHTGHPALLPPAVTLAGRTHALPSHGHRDGHDIGCHVLHSSLTLLTAACREVSVCSGSSSVLSGEGVVGTDKAAASIRLNFA